MVQTLAILILLLCSMATAQVLPVANGGTGAATATSHKVFGNLTGSTASPAFSSDTTTINTTSPLGGGATFHLGDTITLTCTTCNVSSATVSSFSSGNLSPLFTTSVATPTITPALSFSLSNAAAHTVLGNLTGSTGAPSYSSDSTVISTTSPLGGGATFHLGDTVTLTCTGCLTSAVTSVATTSPITGGPITSTGTIACATCAIGPGSSSAGHLATFTNTNGINLSDGGAPATGTVTSVATTSPLGGGTITSTGTLTCTTCVVASSPGVGIAHFAGSTQTVTSSAVNLAGADVTGILPGGNLPALSGRGFLIPTGIPGSVGNGGASLVQATNRMECVLQSPPYNATGWTHFSYRPQASAGAGTHVGFAIYSADGTTRVMTTGALDGTLTGKQTFSVASFSLVYGTSYLYCWTDDAATSTTWAAFQLGASAVWDSYLNTTATANFVKGANASVAGAPPTSLGALSAETAGNNMPIAFIEP